MTPPEKAPLLNIETFEWYRKQNQENDETESGQQAAEDFEQKIIEWEENKQYEQ